MDGVAEAASATEAVESADASTGAAEFRFDINVGLLAGAERVVLAQGFILGASVLGFIGYAPLLGFAQRKGHSPASVNTAAAPIAIVGLT